MIGEPEHPALVEARRRIANLTACVRRGVNGFVFGRSVAGHYESAYAALLVVEDVLGVVRAGPLADRLRDARWEAEAADLLEPCEVLDREARALAAAGPRCVA
jgi:hypothetical protein